jgi:hypothetical protein
MATADLLRCSTARMSAVQFGQVDDSCDVCIGPQTVSVKPTEITWIPLFEGLTFTSPSNVKSDGLAFARNAPNRWITEGCVAAQIA